MPAMKALPNEGSYMRVRADRIGNSLFKVGGIKPANGDYVFDKPVTENGPA
jgi:hypothetical protein